MEILIWYYYDDIILNSLDSLVSGPLEKLMRDNLGEKAIQRIKRRLFEKYGLTLPQAIISYDKLHDILTEFFGRGSKSLERKMLKEIVQVNTKGRDKFVRIIDNETNSLILRTIADSDKKEILNCIQKDPKTIYQILEETKLPQTSCYRKINQMVEDRLVVRNGFDEDDGLRLKSKYVSLIKKLKIDFDKNKVLVDVVLNNKPEDSLIIKTLYN